MSAGDGVSLRECAGRYDTDKGDSGYLGRYEEHFGPLRNRHVRLLELGIDKGGSLMMWRDYFPGGTIVGLDIEPVRVSGRSNRLHVYRGLQQDASLLDRIRAETAPGGFDIVIDDASHLGDLTEASFWHLFRNHLRAGGVYVIEDWRTGYWPKSPDGRRYCPRPGGRGLMAQIHTRLDRSLSRALAARADGDLAFHHKLIGAVRKRTARRRFRSHDWGMVGFVKGLIDELGMDMITSPLRGGRGPVMESRFERVVVYPGQVFVYKRGASPADGNGEAG